jgi:putative membrane protein
MMGWHGWGMGGGWFGMVLFWILAILAIVWLARALGLGRLWRDRDDGHPPQAPTEDRALAVLRERYARGEIDAEEFERRKRDLVAPPT